MKSTDHHLKKYTSWCWRVYGLLTFAELAIPLYCRDTLPFVFFFSSQNWFFCVSISLLITDSGLQCPARRSVLLYLRISVFCISIRRCALYICWWSQWQQQCLQWVQVRCSPKVRSSPVPAQSSPAPSPPSISQSTMKRVTIRAARLFQPAQCSSTWWFETT